MSFETQPDHNRKSWSEFVNVDVLYENTHRQRGRDTQIYTKPPRLKTQIYTQLYKLVALIFIVFK